MSGCPLTAVTLSQSLQVGKHFHARRPSQARLHRALYAFCVAWLTASCAHAQTAHCGSLENSFGPFDYRTVRGQQLQLVESAHFTPPVEALIRGQASGKYPGGDLDYTLRAFPNHHRALASTARLAERDNTPQPQGMRYTVECWFERAVTFQPDDAVARMLFARFLLKAKRRAEALRQLTMAQPHARDNPFTHYNLGSIFLEAEQYDEALKHAHRALELGFPRTELKAQLQAMGRWREPEGQAVPAAAVEAKSAATASAAASAP